MSHKYGNIFLPERPTFERFELIKSQLSRIEKLNLEDKLKNVLNTEDEMTISTDHDLLLFCYDLDTNQSPHRYLLKSWDKLIKHYNMNETFSGRINQIILRLILKAAKLCCDDNLLSEAEYNRFLISGFFF